MHEWSKATLPAFVSPESNAYIYQPSVFPQQYGRGLFGQLALPSLLPIFPFDEAQVLRGDISSQKNVSVRKRSMQALSISALLDLPSLE